MLDKGANWKALPREFGCKNAVHRWFTRWLTAGVFENIVRDAGELVEERDVFYVVRVLRRRDLQQGPWWGRWDWVHQVRIWR